MIILPVVLYEFETWCLTRTLREDSRLRVFRNGIMRRILMLHSEEFYRSPNIVTVNKSERPEQVMQPEWKKVGMLSKYCQANPRERGL